MKKLFNILFPNTQTDDKAKLILNILLSDCTTFETIEIFDKVKTELANEMQLKLSKAKEDTRLIEGYFKTQNKVKTAHDEIFNYPINEKVY